MIVFSIPRHAALPAAPTDCEAEESAEIKAAQAGCDDAFRSLVEHHQARIQRVCFHYLGDEDDAREACQDTFVRAHRALSRFVPRARLSTWLHQIALNLCRDRLRRPRPTVPLEHQDPTCGRAAPDEAAILDAELAKLDRGLAILPSRLRDVLVLSCLEGLSHSECAAILKCSERAIEGRLYRARSQLRGWWESDAH